MAIDKIGAGLNIGTGTITSAMIADDAITQADLGSMMSTGTTAPASPFVGQFWYKSDTGVTYQYTSDGASSFWLDISSGGIGTSANRSVDYVGVVDPTASHNGGSATLSVGQIYYNIVRNVYFTCTTATSGSNVWLGNYEYSGGIITTYGSYRVHTFLSSGTFQINSTKSVDYLVVAGGASGGTTAAGGGGAGGVRIGTSLAISSGSYQVIVGDGGAGRTGGAALVGISGGVSSLTTGSLISATGGGAGGGGAGGAGGDWSLDGGSGGGGASSTTASKRNGASGVDSGSSGAFGTATYQGHDGGTTNNGGSAYYEASGGGGSGAVGQNATMGTNAGNGGDGINTFWGMSAANTTLLLAAASAGVVSGSYRYIAGGGGGTTDRANPTDSQKGLGGKGGGGAGAAENTSVSGSGVDGTGSGGGGSYGSNLSGAGGSGIVIIRYTI
jgi:hypothetical protein